ncbi:MAG: phosphatase PAP2 family protein [Planctomycetota bacterium]
MNWIKRQWAAAQPADLVFISYVSFTGVLLAAFGWRLGPSLWIGLTLTHVALVLFGLWVAGIPLRGRSVGSFFRDAYPIASVVYLYWELRYLALLFTDGYHDNVILWLEETLFGEQLAMTLSERFPFFWLSELMHFFYASYWFLLPLALVLLYVRGNLRGFRSLIFAQTLVYFGCYLVFMFWPVTGPHYQFPMISGELANGAMYRWVHWMLEDGGSKGAAFPSSHVAVAVAVSLVTWRVDRLVFKVTLPIVIGLTISTVYGRFHYGIDALAGILAAVLLVWLATQLQPRLERRSGGNMGNAPGSVPV